MNKSALAILALFGAAAYLISKKSTGSTSGTPGFDPSDIFAGVDASAPVVTPDIPKQTSTPVTNLGGAVQAVQQAAQIVNVAKTVAPAVAGALGLTEAPAVAAAVTTADTLSAVAPAALAAPLAPAAEAGISAGAAAGLGVGAALAATLGPIGLAYLAFDTFASNPANKPAALLANNQATQDAEMPKYSVYGSGGTGTSQDQNKSPLTVQQETGTRFKPGNQ
jgi:hypothetical protein